MKDLLRRKGFRSLLIGQGVSALGDWMGTVAFMALVLTITGSPTAVGGILALRLLPAAIGGPLAAKAATRWDRRHTMLAMDAARAGMIAAVLYLGPDVEMRRWTFLTPGAVVAVVVWLLASGLFAVYVSFFGSYNKAWGSLAGVIIMLTWLWLTGCALLFGAEINAEVERSRELRQGKKQAATEIQAPTKA